MDVRFRPEENMLSIIFYYYQGRRKHCKVSKLPLVRQISAV